MYGISPYAGQTVRMSLTPAIVLAALDPERKELLWQVSGVTFLTLVFFAAWVWTTACYWRIFEKAGQSGWKILVPGYHHVILCRISGLSGWWALPLLLLPLATKTKGLTLIPLFAWWVWTNVRMARRFGKGFGFGLGLSIPVFDFYFRNALAHDQSTYAAQA